MSIIRITKSFILMAAILTALTLRATHAEAEDLRHAVVAGGCFWCVESDFESVKGVKEVISGYTGGETENPTYRQVASKRTGHVEAVMITYDADMVSLAQLYYLFFRSIDPTDPGGQFCDRGSPYHTAIFVASDAERRIAEQAKRQAQRDLGRRIVTPIRDQGPFYMAEDVHQNYYLGSDRVFTRRGTKAQSEAYAFYRRACGRDARVEQLWGDAAPFVRHHRR